MAIYRMKVSGETLTARERLGRFNRAVVQSGGLTRYGAKKLEEHAREEGDPHLAGLAHYANVWPAHATSENFAECTRIFTSDDPESQPGVRADVSDADWNELHSAWMGLWDFMEARY